MQELPTLLCPPAGTHPVSKFLLSVRTSSNVLVWHEVHLSHSCKSLLIWHGTLPKSNKVPCLGKQRAFQDTCFSAPPSLWAALLRKYLPLVFIYMYYKNRPHPTQNPDLSLMVSIINRYWIEFQAVNSFILLKLVLSALDRSSADKSKVLMSHLNC